MKRIAQVWSNADSGMMLSLLAANDIPARLHDMHSAVTISNWTEAIGGMSLQVLDRDVERASELLEEVGQPVWSRPPARILVVFALAWLISAVPPPGLGTCLYRRVNPGTAASSTPQGPEA